MVSENFKGRNFLITINEKSLEFYADILEYLKNLASFQYLICCEHIGQDNKHYHLYVQYNNTKRLAVSKLYGAHIDKCYGSAQQNISYVKAEDQKHKDLGVTAVLIDEEGEPKLKGGNYTVGFLRECEDPYEIPGNLYNCYKNIRRDFSVNRARDFRKNVKVYWIQGPSGVGKTNKAIDIATEFEDANNCGTDFIKYCNGFYLGTTRTARVCIYDDFRDSHMKPSEFINLIDYNKHWLNIKGDCILNEYLCIIITSVQKLSKIYRNVDDEPRLQWERRIEVIDMFPPELVHIGGYPVGYRTDFNDLENYELTEHEVTDDWDSTRVVIN